MNLRGAQQGGEVLRGDAMWPRVLQPASNAGAWRRVRLRRGATRCSML